MKILFILDFYYPSKGGVEKVFKNLISTLPKSWEIIILTSRFSKNLPKFEQNKNIKIYRIGKNRLFFSILAPFKAIKLAKNINLIHTSTYNAAYISFFIKIFYPKIPIILTSHEILGKKWFEFKGKIKGFFYKKLEDLIYKFGFFYVFVSNHVKNLALISYNLKLQNTYTIYNGIDIKDTKISITRKDLGFNSNHKIGIFLGRPGWTKGLDILINNIEKIIEKYPHFKLILLLLEKNNTKKLKILEKVKNNKNIKIIFEASEDQIYNYISLADIGFILSRSEGFGLAACELSIMGKDKILSNTGALPEINWGKCLFFNTNNEKEFLEKIDDFFNGKIKNYGYNKHISVKKMTQEYIKIYKKLTNK